MIPKLFDAHTHVQFPQFDKDRDEIIKKALESGLWMVNAGADKESSKKSIELARKYPEGVYATVGQHPNENDFDYNFYKSLAEDPKVVAIGEFGFEYYIRDPNLQRFGIKDEERERQKEIFLNHLKLAQEVSKPLMIHCRDSHSLDSSFRAFDDLIDMLETNRAMLITGRPGVLHFFTGSLENAKKLLELGFYFTFGGLITFSRDFDEVIQSIPLSRLLLETDAPYVSPAPYRGKRNEPAYIIEVARKLAEIKKVSFEETCKATAENAVKIFNLS